MSTRANVIIKEGNEQLFFYRHSDGYPEGTMPTLKKYLDWVKAGTIRDNVQQSAGWLTLIGAIEYGAIPEFKTEEPMFPGGARYGEIDTIEAPKDWKVGAYEPTTGIHGDIEFLYVIDLRQKTIECFEDWTEGGKPKGEPCETYN